jgi:hypothetical protein
VVVGTGSRGTEERIEELDGADLVQGLVLVAALG